MDNPYSSPTSKFAQPRAPSSGIFGVAAGVALSAVPAAISALAAGHFAETFAAFNADIPLLTGLFLHYHYALWLVPAGVLAYWWRSRVTRRSGRAFLFGLAAAVLLIPACAVALYLPMFKLAAVVG